MNTNPVILLGGSGYIGRNICTFLKEQNVSVTPISSKQCDLTTTTGQLYLEKLLQTPSQLIIASAITRTAGDDLDTCLANISQTKYIIKACQNFPPKSICFLSAADVYGHSGNLVNEDIPLNPQTPYGCYKVFSESILRSELKALCPIDIIRFSGVFGGMDDSTSLIYRFCQRILNNQPIILNNSGNIYRDFLPISLLLETILSVLNQPKNNTFNVATGEEVTIKALVEELETCLKHPAKIELSTDITTRDFNLSLNSTKLRNSFTTLPIPFLMDCIQNYAMSYKKYNMTILPETINAAVLVETNKPLVIKKLHCPQPQFGQVLIKLAYSGLCHSQLMEVRGKRGQDKYLPHLLGHEGVGTVIEVGEGVSKVNKDDRVVLGWIKGEGLESKGQTYQSIDGEIINAGAVTTFSDYAVVSENRVVLCPKEISSKVSVLFGCALPTGAGMVLNELKPKVGSSVLILGLGGIGLSALIALNEFKLADIIAFDIEPKKLILAKKLGATHTFLTNKQDINKFKQTFPSGVDYALESAGLCQTIELAFSLIKKQGLCLFASHPEFGEKISLDPHELICGKKIKGSWGGNSSPDTDIPKLAKIIAKK